MSTKPRPKPCVFFYSVAIISCCKSIIRSCIGSFRPRKGVRSLPPALRLPLSLGIGGINWPALRPLRLRRGLRPGQCRHGGKSVKGYIIWYTRTKTGNPVFPGFVYIRYTRYKGLVYRLSYSIKYKYVKFGLRDGIPCFCIPMRWVCVQNA
jgi:hypothetical protein